jgi:hypothetical protein
LPASQELACAQKNISEQIFERKTEFFHAPRETCFRFSIFDFVFQCDKYTTLNASFDSVDKLKCGNLSGRIEGRRTAPRAAGTDPLRSRFAPVGVRIPAAAAGSVTVGNGRFREPPGVMTFGDQESVGRSHHGFAFSHSPALVACYASFSFAA